MNITAEADGIGTSEREESPDAAGAGVGLEVLTFTIGEEEFGVAVAVVQEVRRTAGIARVPRARAGLEGLMNVRGRIVPAWTLHNRLGMSSTERTGSSRVVVIDSGGRTSGIVVDRVGEILRFDAAELGEAPSTAVCAAAGCVRGVAVNAERRVNVLDPGRLFEMTGRAA